MLMTVGFTSCSDDDDKTSVQFTSENVVGTWEITSVSGTVFPNFSVGTELTFNADGSCQGAHSMETAYRIEKGKIYTYFLETEEPMYIYSVNSADETGYTVLVKGTLDESNQSITIHIKKRV